MPKQRVRLKKEAETGNRKVAEFYELAKKFRAATEPAEVKRLGDQLGRMVFK